MTESLLDTDMFSEIIKGRDQKVAAAAKAYLLEHSHLTISSVSIYEILYGLGAKSAYGQIRRFLELVKDHRELVPTSVDYRLAADIRASLHRMGNPIGTADPIIAACAVERALPLVTGNHRHYGYIVKAGFALRLENWRGHQTSCE